ncbi:MAG: glycine cleavage system aminomethyltransferase GcvT [Planctomycetaceae bacterium]
MLETPLHDWHAENGARMVDFAGWHMPVQYSSIVDEHTAVRTQAGMFDIAHMGRVKFTGPDACAFLDRIVTNNVAALEPGQIRYALVCKEDGGILDDVLVYRFEDFYMLVVNASNREKILTWIDGQKDDADVTIEDLTTSWFMLAIQGPKAIEIAQPFVEASIEGLKYYHGCETTAQGNYAIVTRTGYTGEDGCEIIVENQNAVALWTALMDAGQSVGLKAAGLGCRDTLRLEAAMPLYGHELDEQTDPYTAGLSFGVKLKAADFIGKEAVTASKARTDRLVRVGLELEGRRIAREETAIMLGDDTIGKVTSGTFSPTLQKSLSMGYVAKEHSAIGTELEVDLRGKRNAATVVKLPFYKRA